MLLRGAPERAAQIFRGLQGFGARDGTCCDSLPWFGVLAGRDDCGGTPFGDRIVALSGVAGTVRGPGTGLLANRERGL